MITSATGFVPNYFNEVCEVARSLDYSVIEDMASRLAAVRERGGRLFLLGVGGSAANCAHAVNDFRKLCGIECYAPTDNVSELTARTNDEGWDSVFSAWLTTSRISEQRGPRIFRWRRKRGTQREHEYHQRSQVSQISRKYDFGNRWARWRLYETRWRLRSRHPDDRRGTHHASRGGFPSRRLALYRFSPRPSNPSD